MKIQISFRVKKKPDLYLMKIQIGFVLKKSDLKNIDQFLN